MVEGGSLLARSRERLGLFCVVFFAIVVVAAGASAVALLLAPGSTDRYFSWTLRPPPAAALIGGLYLASAVIFAWGLTRSVREARALLVGVLGLAVPTLVLTLVHDEVFDFGRWQALAWVALFVTAPVSASTLLLRLPKDSGAAGGRAPAGVRTLLFALAAVLLVLAVLIWFDGTRQDLLRYSPVDLIRLTGTYLGAWCSFLALLCAYAGLAGRREEARVALFTVAVAAAGVALALLRSAGEIRHPVAAVTVSVALALLALGAATSAEREVEVAGADQPPLP